MLTAINHVGYLTADVDTTVERLTAAHGLHLDRRFALPQFELDGAFLSLPAGGPRVEVFTFDDAALVHSRLGEDAVRLDHVAYDVEDADAAVAALRAQGFRIVTPDLRDALSAPVVLAASARHAWAHQPALPGWAIQVVQS